MFHFMTKALISYLSSGKYQGVMISLCVAICNCRNVRWRWLHQYVTMVELSHWSRVTMVESLEWRWLHWNDDGCNQTRVAINWRGFRWAMYGSSRVSRQPTWQRLNVSIISIYDVMALYGDNRWHCKENIKIMTGQWNIYYVPKRELLQWRGLQQRQGLQYLNSSTL